MCGLGLDENDPSIATTTHLGWVTPHDARVNPRPQPALWGMPQTTHKGTLNLLVMYYTIVNFFKIFEIFNDLSSSNGLNNHHLASKIIKIDKEMAKI